MAWHRNVELDIARQLDSESNNMACGPLFRGPRRLSAKPEQIGRPLGPAAENFVVVLDMFISCSGRGAQLVAAVSIS